MHKKMYASVTFFKEKDSIFLAWIGTVIRPFTVQEQQFIYKEGETIMEIYFILKGQIGFALPRFLHKVYHFVDQGDIFGHQDIFGIRLLNKQIVGTSSKKKNDLKRYF